MTQFMTRIVASEGQGLVDWATDWMWGDESKRRWSSTLRLLRGVTAQKKIALLEREHRFGVGHDELCFRRVKFKSA